RRQPPSPRMPCGCRRSPRSRGVRGSRASSSGPTSSPTTWPRHGSSMRSSSAGPFGRWAATASRATTSGPCAGSSKRARPKDRSAEPRWFGYVSVADVEGAQREVSKRGGRVLAPPRQVPERGEQAVFADPEGAVVGVLASSSGDPEDFLADVGDWIWIELLSRDASRAAEFYRGVAGYEVVENDAVGRVSDYLLVSEGYARATVRTLSSARPDVRPTWLPFVRVRSIGESVALAKRLGGAVLLDPTSALRAGRVAVVADPTGAAIGLL